MGSLIGGLISRLFPELLQQILLLVVVGLAVYQTINKALELYKKESKANQDGKDKKEKLVKEVADKERKELNNKSLDFDNKQFDEETKQVDVRSTAIPSIKAASGENEAKKREVRQDIKKIEMAAVTDPKHTNQEAKKDTHIDPELTPEELKIQA